MYKSYLRRKKKEIKLDIGILESHKLTKSRSLIFWFTNELNILKIISKIKLKINQIILIR